MLKEVIKVFEKEVTKGKMWVGEPRIEQRQGGSIARK